MKQPHDDIFLAKYSVEKSAQALETGIKLLEIDLQAAQNRIYYSVFYLVLALGYLDGFKTGKHHQLMGWFNKKYIYQDKIFVPDLNKIYAQLMIDRDNFDYTVTSKPLKEDILKNLEDAKYFIDKVKPYILSRIEYDKRNKDE